MLRDYLAYVTLSRLGKLFYGVIVTVAVAELSMPWIYPQQEVVQRDLVVNDPTLGFRMVPHYRGHMNISGLPLETNSWGLRDRQYGDPPAGGLRIYVLGDSMVFGLGVTIEETFTRFLEEALQRRLGCPVEVVNGGVPGYGTLQELALFERTASTIRPDLVLVAVTVLNDFADDLKFSARQRRPASRNGEDHNGHRTLSIFSRARRWLRSHSQLYLLVRHYRAGVSAEKMMALHARVPSRDVDRELELTQDTLRRFAQAVQRTGAGFGVIIIPAHKQVSPTLWDETLSRHHLLAQAYTADQPDARLVNFARQAGIPVLDLLPVLRAHERQPLYYHGDSEHWQAAGHALVAGAIADFLLDNALVKKPVQSVSAH
jgi:lysophospholipase L1-like esterase